MGAPLRSVPRRLLLVKFGGLGEAVLARALVEHLRARHPAMEIDVLVDGRTREVMSCGSAARVYCYNPGCDGIAAAVRTLRAVRANRYDAAVDFEQTSLLTAAFVRASAIPVRVGLAPPGDNPRARFFTHPVPLSENDSMWSAMVRMGRTLDRTLPGDLSTVPIPFDGQSERFVARWWEDNVAHMGRRAVALHVGVGPRAGYRRWPLERFVEVARQIRRRQSEVTIVLTGDRFERPLIDGFLNSYDGASADATMMGSVEKTAALLRRCDLLVSNDTGVMHLGAAMGTPTVAVFGASNPVYWAPVGPRATYVYSSALSCSPCINSYRRIIPNDCDHPVAGRCMLDVQVNNVLDAARAVIRGGWLG